MKIVIFLGSVRNSAPPKPTRLGERVALHCQQTLITQGHSLTLIDPLELKTSNDIGSKTFKPHFSYGPGKAPEDLQKTADIIIAADAYVMISPEYNHSMSPALADLLNHFGSSLFSYKPSAIVTYSAGQWGGTRAAFAMRSFLSELGCLPVSAMIHIPKAHEVFNLDGSISDQQNKSSWDSYFARTWDQLSWWGQAAMNQRQQADPKTQASPFLSDPSQRNAGKTKT